ncbi:MAG: Trm112 family protein [Thaumarchaeota archaeon]|nr:Trm112 family protein [Nitrososphaerota archaeon]
MKRSLLDILACPIDKHYPLELYELESKGDIVVEGVLRCPKCNRYYPIIDEIPIMLPDELRDKDRDLSFLEKWKDKLPRVIVYEGLPHHL